MMGQICHHFSWTLDYLLEFPDWYVVQRMLIDAPKYQDEEKAKTKPKLKEQTSDDIMAMLKKYEK